MATSDDHSVMFAKNICISDQNPIHNSSKNSQEKKIEARHCRPPNFDLNF